MQTVEANGLKFAYLEWGQGPLVLMCHGFPDTAHTWDFAGPKIAERGFRVVAPYLRGYAPTTVVKTNTTSRELGEDVVALIRALGSSKAHLVGHDWGAEAVAAAAGLAPEKLSSLTMVAIPHRMSFQLTPSLLWKARHFATLRFPGALAGFMKNDFAEAEALCRRWSPTWKLTPDDLKHVKEAFRVEGSANAALGYYRGTAAVTPRFMRGRIAVPTLAIAGADDPTVEPSDFEAARSQFSGRYEVAVIGGGHFCHRESPDDFVKALGAFLKTV